MLAARVRFVLFCLLVLGLPAALMSTGEPELIDAGKLALILGPAIAGLALNLGLGNRSERVRWRVVAVAALTTLVVAAVALSASLAMGASTLNGQAFGIEAAASALGGTLLTSVLEEVGWAGGGLALACKAFGRRIGVAVLGFVWAAWHLSPAFLRIGLFPELEAAPPLMLLAFVVSCLIYRELLTVFVERARSWIAAALAHAAPNVLITAFITQGLVVLERSAAWPLFPAPGGLLFPVLVLAALLLIRRFTDAPARDVGT